MNKTILPLAIIAALLSFIAIVPGAIESAVEGGASSGGGGGQALVDAATAEWEEGEANGTHQSNGQKYWSFMGWPYRVPWCACFASYCSDKAGLHEAGIAPKSSLAIDFVKYYVGKEDRGTLHKNDGTYTPKPGDFVVWANGEHNDSQYNINNENSKSHVGIVVGTSEDGKEFYTIEGNASNSCKKKSYPLGHNADYFATPAYPADMTGSGPVGEGQTATLPKTHEHKAPDGKGNVEVGATRGTTDQIGRPFTYTNYEKFYGRWSKGTNQRKLSIIWDQKGRASKNACATIDGRYLVAVCARYGAVGDYLDIRLDNGTVIQAIVADEKSSSDTFGKTGGDIESCQLGHYYKNGQISVVEFETVRNLSSGDVSTTVAEWKGTNVVSITNKGSYFKQAA